MCPTTEDYIEHGKKLYAGICEYCGKDRWYFESFEHTWCEEQRVRALKTPYQKALEQWNNVRKEMTKKVFERDGKICAVCFSTENITIDHIKPLIKGGTNDLDNLQPMCGSCNSRKGSKYDQSI